MRYTIAKIMFLLILIPFIMGCELKPEDKWPVIVGQVLDADFTVKVTIVEELGLAQFKVAKEWVDVTLDIRTYNANQGWTVKIILSSIDWYFTDYADLSSGSMSLPGSATAETMDGMVGEYIEGSPPQGVTEIKFSFKPEWFPTTYGDWVNGTVVSDKYVYYFVVIIEDMEGRTDSWDFSVTSTLTM